MSTQTLTLELSNLLALPEDELVRKGMLALIEKELRLAEQEIAAIRERYDVFSKEALYQAIQADQVAGHPAWEDTSSGRIRTHTSLNCATWPRHNYSACVIARSASCDEAISSLQHGDCFAALAMAA